MDSYQLNIFCTVTRLHSFSKAAKLLHMSQPAVSAHIKNLEEQFHGQFFERTPHGITLTKAGEIFYDYAQRILKLHVEMEQQVKNVLGYESNQIVVGASTTIGNISLPCSIYLFKEEFPDVNIRLDIANSESIFQKVISSEVDIGVVESYAMSVSEGLTAVPISYDELVLIVPSRKEIKSEITINELLQQPVILRETGSGTRQILTKALEEHGYSINDLNIITEMTTINAIKSSVEAGMGTAIVPRLAVRKEAYLGSLKIVTIKNMPMPLTFNVLYRSNKPYTTLTKEFVNFLSDPDEHSLC